MQRLMALYEKKSDMKGHVLVIYSIVRYMQPDTVLEIGVRSGISGTAILLALAANKKGTLYSIDVNESPIMRERTSNWGLEAYWKFIRANSQTYRWNKPLDILMIDGDHTYKACKADFDNFSPYVKTNGYILLHDSCAGEGIEFSSKLASMNLIDVHKFVEEIPRNYEKITFPYYHGLTILRKLYDETVKQDLPGEVLRQEEQPEMASTMDHSGSDQRPEPEKPSRRRVRKWGADRGIPEKGSSELGD